MVEEARVDRDDIGVPTLVVCMAGHAFVALSGRKTTVKTGLRSAIQAYVFMAAHAQRRNRLVGTRIVTCNALALEFGMGFDDPARHQQLFKASREGAAAAQKDRYDADCTNDLRSGDFSASATHIEYACTAMT